MVVPLTLFPMKLLLYQLDPALPERMFSLHNKTYLKQQSWCWFAQDCHFCKIFENCIIFPLNWSSSLWESRGNYEIHDNNSSHFDTCLSSLVKALHIFCTEGWTTVFSDINTVISNYGILATFSQSRSFRALILQSRIPWFYENRQTESCWLSVHSVFLH